MSAQRFSPKIARALWEAEQEYERLTELRKEADKKRKALRERYRHLFRHGRPLRAGGIEVAVVLVSSGPAFRIAQFLEKHGSPTKSMTPFYSEPSERDDWRVRELPK